MADISILETALINARELFLNYGALHRNKNTPDGDAKALANYKAAQAIAQALGDYAFNHDSEGLTNLLKGINPAEFSDGFDMKRVTDLVRQTWNLTREELMFWKQAAHDRVVSNNQLLERARVAEGKVETLTAQAEADRLELQDLRAFHKLCTDDGK